MARMSRGWLHSVQNRRLGPGKVRTPSFAPAILCRRVKAIDAWPKQG